MQDLLQYVYLIGGFILLIKGADFFVDGSSSVAKKLRVPSMIIGLTIVAMGTSLPEFSVSVSAAIQHKNELAISNVVGSNIFNLMAVVGMCALLCPMKIEKKTLLKEFPLSVLVAILLLIFGWTGMQVVQWEAAILVIALIIFIVQMVIEARKSRTTDDGSEYKILPVWKCIIFIVGGLAGIILGGNLVVNSASAIAASFGLSDNLIGLTIVAVGTSLPELVTSVVAARKNEVDMALGNVIGSNILNILFILGAAGVISPLAFIGENVIDLFILIGLSAITWLMCWPKKQLNRWQGGVMLASYVIYVVYICMR